MSKGEAVLICKQDEVIAKAYAHLREIEKEVEEKQKFIDKQVEDARKKFNEALDNFWSVAEPRLEELKLIEKDQPLRLSRQGVIYKRDESENSLNDFLRGLFK